MAKCPHVQFPPRMVDSAEASGQVVSPLADSGPKLPFRFDTGFALFAKRTPRPFPPPFLSPPSGSFSDPLSTHHQSRDKRAFVGGELIRGWTNGDDAVYASDYFVCANDGVGAWSARPRGHAGLWSRLILHFWAAAMEEDVTRVRPPDQPYRPDPVRYLQEAYERTVEATTSGPNNYLGTTTVAGAQLFYKGESANPTPASTIPLLYVTSLGDSQVMVIRPKGQELIYKSKEQWHWFDCPRQLGTNSPDTPAKNAVVETVELREGDIVLAMTDGVIDNLWSHEIVKNVSDTVGRWEAGEGGEALGPRQDGANGGMTFVAEELLTAAKEVAVNPFAESPFMERAIEEGLASEGGKLDDISVVAALYEQKVTMPRAKRAKQYRKLMEQFSMGFGFREPYQVLVDAELITEANKCKMDLVRRLEDTLHGQVKPMITQCSMRHLYARKSEPGVEAAIEQAKSQFERRRCGHHPDEYPEPLSALECLHSVIDPKNSGVNRHRYVCAINDDAVRASLREIPGIPQIFIRRSVMIMEPMASVTAKARSKDERSKFRAELTKPKGKRKRPEDDEDDKDDKARTAGVAGANKPEQKKKKKIPGRKEPNPLSVKKKKSTPSKPIEKPTEEHSEKAETEEPAVTEDAGSEEAPKRKRRRRHKSKGASTHETAPASDNPGPEAHVVEVES
ncbi:Fcf1-domain-containing protein [Xylariaceae sp. FL0662B]|nr:Fcf1-domain-containing protein [Xylariaceae sp. FL0662B]